MELKKIREMSEAELNSELVRMKKDLFNLRFQHVTGQLENPIKMRDFRAGALRAVQCGAGTQFAGDFHHQDPGLYQSGDLGAVQHIHGRGSRTVPAHQSAGGLQTAAGCLPAYDAKVFRLAHVLRKAVAVSGDVSHRYRDICHHQSGA